MEPRFTYETCNFCPRNCRINRHQHRGYCQSPDTVIAARAALHHWEEPCISGLHGSGTVFFSGCTLRCCFCQNYKISSQGFGKAITPAYLAQIFLSLQAEGAHNINLVTATQYLPSILEALKQVKSKLQIPIVYNSSGYETAAALDALSPYVSVWLPDLKYYSSELSSRYSGAADYFEAASAAIQKMITLTGKPVFEDFSEQDQHCQLLTRGVIIRHMVLPGQKEDSIRLLHWIKDTLPKGTYLLSLLSQYTPSYKSVDYPEINRRITSYEYRKVVDTALELGLCDGFMQEKSSAKEEYTPSFELEGIEMKESLHPTLYSL